MKAWLLENVHDLMEIESPVQLSDVEKPIPIADEILIGVSTCGICHTELDEIEGRAPPSNYPMILGHQVVGRVVVLGDEVTLHQPGDRVGVGWIYSACGQCEFCTSGRENLCDQFRATGRDVFGGYAEYIKVGERFAFTIPEVFTDEEAAPLLCAGAIGYRSLRLTNLQNGQRLGLTGFGASGHLVLKLVQHLYPDSEVYVFARNPNERAFALALGALWAGDTAEIPPQLLHAIIDTTPVWRPVKESLKNLLPGGRLVINAIGKESHDLDQFLSLDYARDLWMEKEIKSVANVVREDVEDFLQIAAEVPIKPKVQVYPFEEVNRALIELKQGRIEGAKVLQIRK